MAEPFTKTMIYSLEEVPVDTTKNGKDPELFVMERDPSSKKVMRVPASTPKIYIQKIKNSEE